MAETGIAAELGRMNFGRELASSLSNIGRMVRESKEKDEALNLLKDTVGLDFSTPEGMQQLQKSIFGLTQLDQPGQEGISAINEAIFKPLQLQQQLRSQKQSEFDAAIQPISKRVQQRDTDIRAGIDVTAGDAQLKQDMENIKKRYPDLAYQIPVLSPPTMKLPTEVAGQPFVGKDGFYHVMVRTPGKEVEDRKLGTQAPEAKVVGSAAAQSPWTAVDADIWKIKDPQEFLNKLPVPIALSVKQLADGTVGMRDLTGGFGGKDRYNWIAAAAKINPYYASLIFQRKEEGTRDFASGKSRQNLNLLNTAVGHLYDAFQNIPANVSTQLFNWVRGKGLTSTGSPEYTNFMKPLIALSGDLGAVYKGTSPTDTDMENWRESFSSAQSPEQLKQGLLQVVDLMKTRFQVLDNAYETVVGNRTKAYRFLDPQNVIKLTHLGLNPTDFDRALMPTENTPQIDDSDLKGIK